MAITLLTDTNGLAPASPVPKELTLGLGGISGNDVLMVVCISARTTTATGWGVTVTWDGTPMTLAVVQDGDLNGFGSGKSYIYYLPVGTVSGLAANAVATATTGETSVGFGMTVMAYSGVDQVSPLNATNGVTVITGATTISLSVSSDPTDRVVGCACFAQTSGATDAAPSSGQTKVTGISTTVGSNVAHVVGDDVASAGSSTAGDWGSFNSAYSYALASFAESAAATPPIILNVNGGSFADPDETNLTLNGLSLNPGGTTSLYWADSATFATANKQAQPISAIAGTTINWDSIDLGTIGDGDNFIFVVTDEGGGGEQVSAAFPFFIGDAEVFFYRVVYTTDGTLGPVLVVPTPFSSTRAAVIRGNSAPTPDTIVPDAVYTICLVDEVTSMGVGIGSSSGPETHQREQVQGAGSLFLLDGGTGPHLVEGTPSLGPDGLTIDFTINNPGYNFEVTVIGGQAAQAGVHQVSVNSSPKTGLGFRPDLLFGSTVCTAGTGDSSFAVMSFGVCIDPGTPQQWGIATDQSSASRNSRVVDGMFLGQLQSTAWTWQMAITAHDPDGYSWSGTDADSVHVLALRLPGRQIFVDTFNKNDVAPGTDQALPDIGFDPGGIILATAGSNVEDPSTPLGGRWSIGVVNAGGQDVSSASALPDTGALVAEQYEDFDHVIATSSVPGTISMLGQITDFGQISTIKWINSLAANTSVIGMFAIDATDFDDGGDVVGVHEY